MDEQEKRETAEAERQYSEAGKKHAEAEELYAEAERQHNEAGDQYAEAQKQYTDTLEASKQAGVKRREEAEQRRAEEEAEQQQQADEAAEQFAGAVRASYRAMSNHAVSAQEHNAELLRRFFNGVINNLRTQAEDNRQMTQELAGRQRRAQEAGQSLTQESVGAYMDLLNSTFSFYQGSVGATKGSTGTGETEGDLDADAQEDLAIEDYDSSNVKQVVQRLEEE